MRVDCENDIITEIGKEKQINNLECCYVWSGAIVIHRFIYVGCIFI